MFQTFTLQTLALALAVEALASYPGPVYRAIGHPVTWMGALITALERRLNNGSDSARRAAGFLALFILLAVTAICACALWFVLPHAVWSALALALIGSSLIAQRSLYDHARAVADALENGGISAGRAAVAMIVGRDPGALDEAGVARAAIESLAENFSDGVVAPVFWFAAFGLPGAALYKAANTADSMIGHRNPRYAAFGFAAARFDDLINLPASRLAALWLTLAAVAGAGTSARRALAAVRRDASKHRSPNAGWPEAAMAGALWFSLAGPRAYGGVMTDDPAIGDGRRDLGAADIRRALALYSKACVIQFFGVLSLAWLTA